MDRHNDFFAVNLSISGKAKTYTTAMGLVFVLLAVVYANSFYGTWIFDDAPNILDNKNVHMEQLDWPSAEKSLYNLNHQLKRPLAFLSLGLNYYFGQTDPWGYHLVNFAVHVLAAWFLFLLIAKTLQLPQLKDAYGRHAYFIALAATVFWAVNPVQVTAVTYIVQRMASMAGLFYVMAMYFYVTARTSQGRGKKTAFFAAAVLSGIFAMASKQNAAMLPVSLFFYDLFLIQGVSRSSLRKNLVFAAIPLVLLAAMAAVYTDFSSLLQGYEKRPFTLEQRLLTQPRILFFYISQLLYPTADRLALIHEVQISTGLLSPFTTLAAIAGIAAAAVFAFVRSAKYPLLCFCILFFLINHVIESSIIPLELIYEHRNYLPSMFFFVPVAVFMARAMDYFSYRRGLQAAIALAAVLVWAGQGHTVYMRNQLFADPVALWADNAQKAPGLSRVHTNLGSALFEKNDYKGAYESYLLAKDADYFHNPSNQGVLYYNLGRYYFHADQNTEKALVHIKKSLEMYPGNWRAWYYAALCETSLGRYETAHSYADTAVSRWPEKETLHYVKALSLLKQSDYEACIQAARQALEKDLPEGRFYKLMGVAYLYEGKPDAAVRLLELAEDRMPGNVELMSALLEAYEQTGDVAARNQLVQELFCEKEETAWRNFFNNIAAENDLNAYEFDPEKLRSIIGKSKDVLLR